MTSGMSFFKVSEHTRARLFRHDLMHLFPDLLDLCSLRVALGLDLVGTAVREGQGEQPHSVAVSGLHVRESLNKAVPLADQGALLVAGDRHPVEVREAIAALHVLDAELNLPERLILIVVQVRQVQLHHPAFELLGGNLRTLRPRDQGLATAPDAEHARSLNVVPLLLKEGIAGLLLASLLAALGELLVLADRHERTEPSVSVSSAEAVARGGFSQKKGLSQ